MVGGYGETVLDPPNPGDSGRSPTRCLLLLKRRHRAQQHGSVLHDLDSHIGEAHRGVQPEGALDLRFMALIAHGYSSSSTTVIAPLYPEYAPDDTCVRLRDRQRSGRPRRLDEIPGGFLPGAGVVEAHQLQRVAAEDAVGGAAGGGGP